MNYEDRTIQLNKRACDVGLLGYVRASERRAADTDAAVSRAGFGC